MVGWVVGLNGNIAISAQSLAWAWAELGNKIEGTKLVVIGLQYIAEVSKGIFCSRDQNMSLLQDTFGKYPKCISIRTHF